MKFNEKFPEHAKAPHTIGPHAEVEVAGGISQSWRTYECAGCRKPTSWRLLHEDLPGTPICSDECLRGFLGV